jgi:hypothetical protein
MPDCLSLFIFPRLTIYRAVLLTSCYLSCYAETFRKGLLTFRMVAITSPSGQSIKEVCTIQRLKSLRQKLRTYGTRAPKDTQKCFHGTGYSLLSQLFRFLLSDQRLYIVKCVYLYIYTYIVLIHIYTYIYIYLI